MRAKKRSITRVGEYSNSDQYERIIQKRPSEKKVKQIKCGTAYEDTRPISGEPTKTWWVSKSKRKRTPTVQLKKEKDVNEEPTERKQK